MIQPELDRLPKLKTEQLTPCVACRKQLVQASLPLFFRLTVQRAGLDNRAIRERVGLAHMWGAGAAGLTLADIFASRDPGVILDDYQPANICIDCARSTTIEDLFLFLMGQGG